MSRKQLSGVSEALRRRRVREHPVVEPFWGLEVAEIRSRELVVEGPIGAAVAGHSEREAVGDPLEVAGERTPERQGRELEDEAEEQDECRVARLGLRTEEPEH